MFYASSLVVLVVFGALGESFAPLCVSPTGPVLASLNQYTWNKVYFNIVCIWGEEHPWPLWLYAQLSAFKPEQTLCNEHSICEVCNDFMISNIAFIPNSSFLTKFKSLLTVASGGRHACFTALVCRRLSSGAFLEESVSHLWCNTKENISRTCHYTLWKMLSHTPTCVQIWQEYVYPHYTFIFQITLKLFWNDCISCLRDVIVDDTLDIFSNQILEYQILLFVNLHY